MSHPNFEPEPDEWEEWFAGEQLRAENEFLKEQLGVDEATYFSSDHTTPEMENQFLRNIIAFEEADRLPQKTIRSLLPDGFELPPAGTMTSGELSSKLNQMLLILEDHGICLDLTEKVPDPVIYEFLLREGLDDAIPMEMPEGFRMHLDGCDGYCPGCFQRPYCETGKDPWPEDEKRRG